MCTLAKRFFCLCRWRCKYIAFVLRYQRVGAGGGLNKEGGKHISKHFKVLGTKRDDKVLSLIATVALSISLL
jgi:hypothetical protein